MGYRRRVTSGDNTIDVSVVAPVFNEAEGIADVVRGWNALLDREGARAEIVLTDDGSTDATGEVLSALAREMPRVRVLTFRPNHGYGFALSKAIAASRGAVVVMLDSDGQFDLGDYPRLYARYRADGLDFVTGYRVAKHDTALRVVADRGLNLLVRGLFGVQLRDTNCALKLVRGDLARSLQIESQGYPTPTEITLKLLAMGARGGEEPVDHRARVAGSSKLKVLSTSVAMLRFLVYLRQKLALERAGVLQRMG
jgi:glycosyltransferase involved in cell wall biosynthesis